MTNRIIYTLTLLCIPWLMHGQSPQALFEVAKQSNGELNALKQEYFASREKAPQVSQLPNPQIGLGGFILPVETRLGAQRLTVSASQMFPWFGTLQAKEDLALSKSEARFQTIANQELELFYRIQQQYYSLYQLAASQDILRKNLLLLNALKALAQTKVAAGKASLADVLRVELKLKEANQELNILEAEKRKPLAKLNQLLGRPVATPVLIKDSLAFYPFNFEKDSLLARIYAEHPTMQMLELQQASARKALDVHKKVENPSFGLGAMYAVTDMRTDANPKNNGRDVIQLQANISIPLNRRRFKAKTQEEHFRIKALESRKQEASSYFFSNIESAFAEHESAALKYELYLQQVTLLRSTISILETDYSNQAKNFDELLRLEGELLEYELKILGAIVQSHMARAEVEHYLIKK